MQRCADETGRVRRRTPAVVLTAALVLAVLVGCGSQSGSDPGSGSNVGSGAGGAAPAVGSADPAVQTGGLDPALAVAAPGPLSGPLQSADLLLNAPGTLPAALVKQVRAVKGVTAVLSVEMAQVPVQGKVLNVMGVDPATYRPWTERTSATLQSVWDRVAGGEVAVPPDLDKSVLAKGDWLKLGSGATSPRIHVGAYAPQVPSIDAVVNTKWGAKLGMTAGNALLVSTGSAAPDDVRKLVRRVVGDGVSVQALDAVARYGLDPGAPQTALLIGSVASTVGTYRYTVAGGSVNPDPAWVSSHITSDTVPILGTITCNRQLFPQLKAALAEVVARGLADQIHPGEYGGCYNARFIAGSTRLSNHAFGLALDMNVPGNQRGTVGQMNRDVVAIFKKWGFAWGGDWGYTDPMHFEMAALVNPG